MLEKLDPPFEAYPVDLLTGSQNRPEYLALNLKGMIPTMARDDGSTLTECPAIAQ